MSTTPLMNKSNPMLQLDGTLAVKRLSNSSAPRPVAGDPVTAVERETSTPDATLSYAVAIYPYMAEQDDEFDIVVGDTFVVVSQTHDWWVVQRDPQATGVIYLDKTRQGRVPAGCLLETSVPIASAIAEAYTANSKSLSDTGTSWIKKTPILLLNIISTSFPGIALIGYKKKGEEELNLIKGDTLRVFKEYNHWSYVVREEDGDRGWAPSSFIGEISSSDLVPTTPVASLPPSTDGPGEGQVSPMSSAFPVHKSY